MNLIYQNNVTGDTHDITSLLTEAKWSTARRGTPASLQITALPHADIVWTHGGTLALRTERNGTGLFYGYVFKQSYKPGAVSITAYDQVRYLKNKATYVFEGKRADQILRQIGTDMKLKLGELPDTKYVIPSMVEDGKSMLDMILKALDYTMVNGKGMYCLWDDFGTLRLRDVGASMLTRVIGDSSLATGYSYDTDIDGETYTRIKLVRDNKTSGARDLWQFQNSDKIKLWGLLQEYKKVDEKLTSAQIKEMGDKMLALYCRPKRSLKLDALADLNVRAGCLLYTQISDLAVKEYILVEDVAHDLIKQTMSLTLKVV